MTGPSDDDDIGKRSLKHGSELDRQVGRQITKIRDAHALTVEQLSARISVPASTLRAMERGELRPSPTVLCVLAEVFDCSVVDFFRLVPPCTSSPAGRP